MAQLWSTGPCHLFVDAGEPTPGSYVPGVGNVPGMTAPILYLGTGREAPVIITEKVHRPLYSSMRGKRVPYEWMYEGEFGIVTVNLNRWNEDVLEGIDTAIGGTTNVPGTDESDAPGTLMLAEGASYKLWVQFPYQSLLNYTDMPKGYRFFNAFLTGPQPQPQMGTDGEWVRQLTWRCESVEDPQTGQWDLYDDDMTGLPATN
jgi:hypothetical protein